MRDPIAAESVNTTKETAGYMPGYTLSSNLIATSDLSSVSGAEAIFFFHPRKSFRSVCEQVKSRISPCQILVSTTKGVEPDSFHLMSEILHEFFPDNPIGVLSGPNLAKEIGQHQLSASVIASKDPDVRSAIQRVLGSRAFRVYANTDTYGVELGALKISMPLFLAWQQRWKWARTPKPC